MPFLNSIGKEINKAKDGITNQKILEDNSAIFLIFLLSIYIQTIAKTDMNGIDANIPPARELLLEISEITTNKIADMMIFKA